MKLSPAVIQFLCQVHADAQAAGHGGKEAVYAKACQQIGMGRATLLRKIKEITVKPQRKRRSDAGASSLPLDQAQMLSAVLMEGFRANDKHIISIPLALEMLRADSRLFAHRADLATGEVLPISASACGRALRQYKLHPEQLRMPTPAQPQRSEHPNDVWQIDASISTLFYVPEGGVQDMSPAEFYKNKPGNFERIKRQRLTRVVHTDHNSGAIHLHYVAGGESTANMADSFLAAIQQRPGQQMYGVPFFLVMDPGSGMAGAMKNLLRRLQVEPVVNKAGNPRAKGQVENAHNLVECDFESGFKFTDVPSIAWINEQAQRWMAWYNTTRIHSRHGLTRYAKWMEITQTQLRLAPAPELCRELLTHEPVSRKVDTYLHVEFAGRTWSVKSIPGIMVGQRVLMTYNPYNPHAAYAVEATSDGHESLIEVAEATRNEDGFFESGALIGREFKSLPETQADANRKLVERLATEGQNDLQAAAARKARKLPFGGRLEPYKRLDDLPDVATLPRRGTELLPTAITSSTPVVERTLSQFEAAQALVAMGVPMTRELVATLRGLHPDGVPETELTALKDRLTVRAGLRVVAGGAS